MPFRFTGILVAKFDPVTHTFATAGNSSRHASGFHRVQLLPNAVELTEKVNAAQVPGNVSWTSHQELSRCMVFVLCHSADASNWQGCQTSPRMDRLRAHLLTDGRISDKIVPAACLGCM